MALLSIQRNIKRLGIPLKVFYLHLQHGQCLCYYVSILRSLNSFPFHKICPSTKHDAEIAPVEITSFGRALEKMFFKRRHFKLQRPMGGTNLNVVIVYSHKGHNGRHPRERSQRNGPQWEKTEKAEVRRKRKSTDLGQRN